jgi:V/A-type H+-transporting ATPase subunit E
MAQEIKELIAKIQKEGVAAAEKQSAQIKADAESAAKKIIAEAKAEAEKITERAAAQAQKTEVSTRASLQQAGRDLLIGLRKEIGSMLNNLLKQSLRQVLSGEELAGIIRNLINSAPLSLGSQVVVSLAPQDKEKLEKHFLKQLSEETKRQIVLRSAHEINSGFVISFDAGKSSFDFSDQALTDYISESLRPELAQILK